MRSWWIRLLVAISAFAAESALAALWISTDRGAPVRVKPAILRSEQIGEAVVIKSENHPVALQNNSKFSCEIRLFAVLLKDLRKNNPDIDIRGLIASEIKTCSELFEIEKKVDLNGDGRSESIVRTMGSEHGSFFCGATGNCPMWVVRREKAGYKTLLYAGSVENVEIQRGRTGNYNDLITRYDGGIMNHTLAYYSYRNGRYRMRKCVVETSTIGGETHYDSKKLSYCQ